MRRFVFFVAALSVMLLPLSTIAATTQSKSASKKQTAVKKASAKKAVVKKAAKKPAAKKKTTKAASAKKPAATSLKTQGYMTEKNGATFTLSAKNGLYSVQTDAKTKFTDTAGRPTSLKTLLIPHFLEVSGISSGKSKLHTTHVRMLALKQGQGELIGKVMIGPICPVQKENEKKCEDQPYQALLTILQDGKVVAKTGSNKKGYFVVALPDGTYTLHPEKPNDSEYPKADDQQITIKAGTFTLATVKYDSGIR